MSGVAGVVPRARAGSAGSADGTDQRGRFNLRDLIHYYQQVLNGHETFNQELEEISLLGEINLYTTTFKQRYPKLQEIQGYGILRKKKMLPKKQLFVASDLHADLKSAIVLFEKLKKAEIVNEDYQVSYGNVVAILGDMVGKGKFPIPVLRLLLKFLNENVPESVFLLKGNHETREKFLEDIGETLSRTASHMDILNYFLWTLPLAVYICCETEGCAQYVQLSHGVFDPHDPMPFLQGQEMYTCLPKVSLEEIHGLKRTDVKMTKNLKIVNDFIKDVWKQAILSHNNENPIGWEEHTDFLWGDVEEATNVGGVARSTVFSIKFLEAFFQLMRNNICRLSVIVRAHQHVGQELSTDTHHRLVHTIPSRSELQEGSKGQVSLYYGCLYTVAKEVKNWMECTIRLEEDPSEDEQCGEMGFYSSQDGSGEEPSPPNGSPPD